MSPDQIKELRKRQKGIALELRQAGMSQEKVAGIIGIPEGTIARWEAEAKKDISILRVKDTYTPPDLRTKIPKKERQKIAERVAAGEGQSQIAADYKVSRQRISQIAKQARQTPSQGSVTGAARKPPLNPPSPAKLPIISI